MTEEHYFRRASGWTGCPDGVAARPIEWRTGCSGGEWVPPGKRVVRW
ncbi:hypothetical protein [Nonomuraea diastatica]|nr:hypothetical protein [Nonomuraea diastatica]